MAETTGAESTPPKHTANTASIGIKRALGGLLTFVAPWGNQKVFQRVLLALSFLALARAATMLVPLAYGWLVDYVSEDAYRFDIAVMWWLLGAYALARICQQGFDEASEYVFVRVAQKAVHKAALQTFRHLHALSLQFHLERQTGGLTRAIERGAKGMEFLLTFALLEVIPLVLELVLVSAILWGLFGFYYALITMLTVLAYSAYTLILTEWRMKFRRRMNRADERAATRAVDSMLNYETIKYFNAEDVEARRFSQALRRYEDAAVISRTSLSMVNVGQGLIIAIGLVLVMGLAGHDIKAGNLTIGSFVVVNTYLIQLYLPLNFLGYTYREIRQSLADMERMFGLLSEKPAIQDAATAHDLRLKGGEISFDNVRFSFGSREVLKGITFRVEAGKRVALVGPSGAGKSTISKLLFRFYDPDSGVIRIDGADIAGVRQTSLRAAIGMVPQDSVLFNTTLGENIAYGRDGADFAEVAASAKMASLDNFIAALPDGYETQVGERGLKLSGGEKQRVAIARAILKDPAIYLFDEATSALDSRTEKQIQASLNAISQDRTTLIIAHRLSTIVSCDEILVLADGEIVERGTHRALLGQGGIYATMWQRQIEEDASA